MKLTAVWHVRNCFEAWPLNDRVVSVLQVFLTQADIVKIGDFGIARGPCLP